jgi:hypothetical protein
MWRWRKNYFLIAMLIFIVEVLIALYVKDQLIRPYGGDYLVVIMIYCFLRAFLNMSVWDLSVITLLFSYAVETGQHFKVLTILGLQHSEVARIIMGHSFSWTDMIAYTAGVATVLIIEYTISQARKRIHANKGV